MYGRGLAPTDTQCYITENGPVFIHDDYTCAVTETTLLVLRCVHTCARDYVNEAVATSLASGYTIRFVYSIPGGI